VRERNPQPGSWTAVDAAARDVPAARDAMPHDAALRDAAPRDAALRDTAPRDAAREDGKRDGTLDAGPAARDGAGSDLAARDAGARDAGQDLRPRDAVGVDSGPGFCGSLRFSCAPYLCDVDAGRCKSFCTSDADCASGRPCLNGACGPASLAACQVDQECASGHCAVVCCATACAGACHSCALPGTAGVCFAVPAGMPDPQHLCPTGTVCGADAGCVPAPDAGSN
jgi:hypothetical protein